MNGICNKCLGKLNKDHTSYVVFLLLHLVSNKHKISFFFFAFGSGDVRSLTCTVVICRFIRPTFNAILCAETCEIFVKFEAVIFTFATQALHERTSGRARININFKADQVCMSLYGVSEIFMDVGSSGKVNVLPPFGNGYEDLY